MPVTEEKVTATATEQPAPKQAKKQSKKAELEQAAKAIVSEPKKNELSPTQAIGTFTETLAKPQATIVKTLYSELLDEFATEGTSKIAIGQTLMRLREELGELYRKFVTDCVLQVLRKSERTLYNYIALSEASLHKFAANKVVRTALFRIWDAEGCFDSDNGQLRPMVDQAIMACGGVPEDTDSSLCESWVRRFVNTVDKLVKDGRQPQPGGRKWDAETITKKHVAVVKGFRSFIGNESVSAKKAIELLAAVLVEAMIEMSNADIMAALEQAKKQIQRKKEDVKEVAETRSEATTKAA